jgi:uncharacterized protein (DUF58 family)
MKAQRGLRARMQALQRPRAPEALPVQIGQRRVYVLPTRFGLFYAGLVAAMVLGALNYNNNPALLLALLLAAAGLASLIAAHLQLSGLRVDALSAEPVAAGEQLDLRLALSCPDGRRRRGLQARLAESAARADSGEDAHLEYSLALPTRRRGWIRPGPIELSTTQPLGLARAWSRTWPDQPLLVYPRPEAHPPPLPDSSGQQAQRQTHALGEDPQQLRSYRPGDPPRTIAWKHSARRNSLVVREFARSQGQELSLDWNGLGALDDEARIARLAAWVDQAEREGRRWRLRLPGPVELGPDQGIGHRHACLRALALLPQRGARGQR